MKPADALSADPDSLAKSVGDDIIGTWTVDVDGTRKLLDQLDEVSDMDRRIITQFLPLIQNSTVEFTDDGQKIVKMPGQQTRIESYAITVADGTATMQSNRPDGRSTESIITLTDDDTLQVLEDGRPMVLQRAD